MAQTGAANQTWSGSGVHAWFWTRNVFKSWCSTPMLEICPKCQNTKTRLKKKHFMENKLFGRANPMQVFSKRSDGTGSEAFGGQGREQRGADRFVEVPGTQRSGEAIVSHQLGVPFFWQQITSSSGNQFLWLSYVMAEGGLISETLQLKEHKICQSNLIYQSRSCIFL